MTYVHIDHEVEDFDAWKPYFDEHDKTRVEMGQQGYELFQSAEDPNHVVAVIEFDSKSRARAFTESEELKQRMAEAGVKGKPTITFLSQVEQRSEATTST